MKKNKILYWSFTGLISLGFLMSSTMYLSNSPELAANFSLVKFPLYFMPFLGLAKLLGALAIVNPWFPKLREWSYAGFVFVLMGAVWLHIATGTPFVATLVFLALTGASYYFHGKYYQAKKAPYFAVA